MQRILFFIVLVFPVFAIAQQPHPILRSFDATEQPNGILLKWVIYGGEQCQGTRVFRADNSFEFELINHIPGICGGFTDDETYLYFDSIPFANTYNHYRPEMGLQGFTDTVTVFFEDFGSARYRIFSDHAGNRHQILFNNDQNKKAHLQLFDRMGNSIYTETGTDSDFVIRVSGWKSGVYLFRISGVVEKDIQGKLYFGDQ